MKLFREMWRIIRAGVGAGVKRLCGIETIYGHTFAPALLGRNPVVVDFGCNRGDFAAEFRRRYPCRYRAADANPAMVAAATERLGLEVEHVALGGNDGEVTFFLSGNPEASSIYPAIAGYGASGRVRVPALTYESWALKHGIDAVALLKLDIEGAELDFLEKWDGCVARPGQITVEFHDFLDPSQLPRVQSCIDRLKSYGYEYFNATRLDHIDCLFVDRLRLGRFQWGWLDYRRKLFSWSRTMRDCLRGRPIH